MSADREFDKHATSDDVLEGVDLSGRHFVISGATSGLGEESARAVAAHGADVTMLARDEAKLADALARVGGAGGGGEIEGGIVDLASLASIREGSAGLADGRPIDVLINNAGVMAPPLTRTADGFELQFGTNHLGHFLLTLLLVPALRRGEAPRVVTLSSAGHGLSDVDLEDPNYESQEYDPWIAYGRSKTANAHFAYELAKRLDGVLSFSVHPGAIETDLMRHLPEEVVAAGLERVKDRAKTIPQGAATQIYAATAPALESLNGVYFANCAPGKPGEPTEFGGIKDYLYNAETTSALWELSERLVGESLP
ncbi:MAG TPA: SDR family NAD(P)-dependent oxidoreductase [Polyangia bacterium]|nr:SDR family NAD(P)-dependent oxidoreductase [Polyangia bacterium]